MDKKPDQDTLRNSTNNIQNAQQKVQILERK
jgi:hypothetical protein